MMQIEVNFFGLEFLRPTKTGSDSHLLTVSTSNLGPIVDVR